MSEIISTDFRSYDMGKRKDFYAYLCAECGLPSRVLSYLEQHMITYCESLEAQNARSKEDWHKMREDLQQAIRETNASDAELEKLRTKLHEMTVAIESFIEHGDTFGLNKLYDESRSK